MNKEEEKASRKAWYEANPNYNKVYYQANKKKAKAWQKVYRKANKERVRASNKAWRDANKEKIKHYDETYSKENKAHRKAYREANVEKIKASRKIYRKANLEKIKAGIKAWSKANLDKRRETQRKRRALKQTTQVERIKEKEIYLRDGWVCQICHKRVDKGLKYPSLMSASLDHIIPLNEGGTHTYSNLQLAHFRCNSSKCNNVLPQGEQLRLF